VSLVPYEQLPPLDERTPEEWLEALGKRLDKQAQESKVFEDFYNGVHPMQFATSKYREAFGNLFSAFADNWCQIVVDAAAERLKVIGFQVGGSTSSEAWDLWQQNNLDLWSTVAHTEAGKNGAAYLLVDPNADEYPLITVEHPQEVIVAVDPANRRERLAALKRWQGDDGYLYATLYLPDVVLKFESADQTSYASGVEWVPRQNGEPFEVANTLGEVPVIPLYNKPGLMKRFHSDLEPAIPLQNAVNKLCSDLIVTSEYGAYPQRVATGVEVPKDPDTGEPIKKEQQVAAMSRLWTFEKPTVTVTSLSAADLSNFTVAIEMLIQHLAAQTRTPPHYLLGQIVNASGDALSVAEAGLVSKCRAKTLYFSDAWEEALALALGKDEADCEVMWANPERQSPQQLGQAAVLKKQVGVPLKVLWLELGYTPEQVDEMEKELEAEQKSQLEQALLLQEATVKATLQAQVPGTTPAGQPPAGQPPAPKPSAQGQNPGGPPPKGGVSG